MVWGVGAGRLQAAGFDLEYQCFGPPPGQAPTIVLLHEGLGAVALWRDFPQALADATGWGVFAYSRAGYGRSGPRALPWPLDYMTREATHVLPDVLQAIGFQNGILMGHSDGATIAAIYAGSVEDFRVRGLVLMAPHFFTEPMGLAAIAKARTAYEQGDLRAKLAKYHDTPDIAFRGWNDSWLAEGFAKWNVADVIDYFRIPTLAIQGDADEYGSLAQIEALETRSYAPVDVEILPQCGHAPHLDAPQAVLAAVGEFCARLARIEAAQPETA
ncbi:MAG: alpha/beta fold hydrolase [Lutimaribacter sp.]